MIRLVNSMNTDLEEQKWLVRQVVPLQNDMFQVFRLEVQ